MTSVPAQFDLSSRLVHPLEKVARRRRRIVLARALLIVLLTALSLLLVGVLTLGLFPGLKPAWRYLAAGLVWLPIAGVAGWVFTRPGRRRSLVATALDVDRSLSAGGASTHERLASTLQLARPVDPRFAPSQALVRRLVEQAEHDVAAVRPAVVVSARPLLWLAVTLLVLAGVWSLLAVALPPSRFLRPLLNLVAPWQETPAFLSEVSVVPGDLSVAYGDPIRLAIHVNPTDLHDRDRRVDRANLIRLGEGTTPAESLPLTRLGPREFEFQQRAERSFRYRVETEAGDSRVFSVTVDPVSEVASIAVRYEYPRYSGLPPHVQAGHGNGRIEGLAGTRVTITVVPTSEVAAADCRLNVHWSRRQQEAGSEGQPIDLAPADLPGAGRAAPTSATASAPSSSSSGATQPTDAAATQSFVFHDAGDGRIETAFEIAAAGNYEIDLKSGQGYSSRDRSPRSIVVIPDLHPEVTMTSPTEELVARPDDVVPITYEASDDFALAKLELVTQVEGSEPTALPLALSEDDRQSADGRTTLDLAAALKASGNAPPPPSGRGSFPRSLVVWLRVTDNREPTPQIGESDQQTIRLDRNAESLAIRQDREKAKDFSEAIKLAIKRLEEVRPEIDPQRFSDRAVRMNNVDRRRAATVKESLETAAGDLIDEADQQAETPYAKLAEAAKTIAERRILNAAQQAARIDLHADQPAQRMTDALLASQAVSAGKKELEELLKKLDEQSALTEAQHKLEELARKQEALNKEQEANPDAAEQEEKNRGPNSRQALLRQQTQQVVNETPQLRDPEALEQSRLLSQLIKQVVELEKKQADAIQRNQRAAGLAAMSDEAARLVERQSAMNDAVAAFAKSHADALKQAQTRPPNPSQLNNATEALKGRRLEEAAAGLVAAARQLAECGKRLDRDKGSAGGDDAMSRADGGSPAAEAADLAARQQALADETSVLVQTVAAARQQGAVDASELAPSQRQLADDSARTYRPLDQLRQLATRLQNPALVLRAVAADDTMHRAESAQRQSADAQGNGRLEAAAGSQEAAQNALVRAEQALRGERVGPGGHRETPADAEVEKQSPPPSPSAQDGREKTPAEVGKVEVGKADDGRAGGDEAGVEQAVGEQAVGAPPANAGPQPGGNAAAKGASAGKADAPVTPPSDPESPEAQQVAMAEPHPGERAENQGEDPEQEQEKDEEQSEQTAKQAVQQAAQSTAEATSAQQEAAQGNPSAAKQAAKALKEAAKALARAAGQGEPGEGQPGDGDAQAQAQQGQAQDGQPSASKAGDSGDPNKGLAAGAGGDGGTPAAVTDLGITPSTWTRLAPLQRQELLNAAQQSGPAEYQTMIKNYYTRLARMQSQPAGE